MQGMGKEWEGTIAKRGRAVFKETGRYSYVALLLLSGAAFGWLGTLLLLVGGSSYYVFGALALFATAALFARRDRRAAYVYGLFLLGTLLWSIAEIGFRSEEHTSELQSLMRISYAVFCLTKKNKISKTITS